MEDSEIKEQVRKKRFLIDAFLYTSSLTPDTEPTRRRKHAVTGHFLQAVILELIIKILYELDKGKAAPFTHNLLNLFNELNSNTRHNLVSKFDEARERRRRQFSGIEEVEFHPLEDVLSNNERTIKNFKYDAMGVPSNSSVDGEFYQAVFRFIDQKVEDLNV